jgi:hypothetical protein
MTKREAVEALDNSLRDIMDRPNQLLGGGEGRPWFSVVILGRCCRLFDEGQGLK